MARIASDHPRVPVVDVVADGLTQDEIAARFEAWLTDLDSKPRLTFRSARPTSCTAHWPTTTRDTTVIIDASTK